MVTDRTAKKKARLVSFGVRVLNYFPSSRGLPREIISSLVYIEFPTIIISLLITYLSVY